MESFGGTFDVVIDPTLLAIEPVVGGVISGYFWLSGRLTNYTRKKGFIQRLFGSR